MAGAEGYVALHTKCWYVPGSPHTATARKTTIDIFTAVRTSSTVGFIHGDRRTERVQELFACCITLRTSENSITVNR